MHFYWHSTAVHAGEQNTFQALNGFKSDKNESEADTKLTFHCAVFGLEKVWASLWLLDVPL